MTTSDAAAGSPKIPRYIALLWGRTDPSPRRGPRPTLSIHDIGDAAVAIADDAGFDAVSMKAVASRLGLTTMSLYRYVESRDDMLEVMVDAAYGPADRGLTASGGWRDRITAWALAVVDGLRERPWLATVPLRRPPVGPNVLGWTDCGVQSFADTHLTGQEKLSALLLVDGFVRHHVRQSGQMGLLESHAGADDRPPYETLVAELADASRFPSLAEAVASAQWDPDDDFFMTELSFGLSVILDGLHMLIESRGPGDLTSNG
ncbi:TetR/AcrR family transcriptional regulator [Gordonia sp. NPDC003424]